MNRTGAPADCWLLCMTYVCYHLYHMCCEALKDSVPLTKLYGVTPDMSILLLHTFYQPVFYATYHQSSGGKAAFWVGFGECVGNALTHKLLDNRILSKDQILVSCSHITCYLQNVHYISIYILY